MLRQRPHQDDDGLPDVVKPLVRRGIVQELLEDREEVPGGLFTVEVDRQHGGVEHVLPDVLVPIAQALLDEKRGNFLDL